MQAFDIVILSNGPGELATWVLPVVRRLRQELGNNRSQVRLSVVLSPCPHASGKEGEVARSYPEVDRVQEAKHFFPFLLWGKTAENWDWRDRGVVLFLGGDQFFTVVIGKRLGYRTIVYAEWEARWYRWIDRFGVMKPEILAAIPQKYANKFTVVGDLMADVEAGKMESDFQSKTYPLLTFPNQGKEPEANIELIGILPGSKPGKLAQGIPFGLAIAQYIHNQRPQTRFVIPVAPTVELSTLARFADPQQNPLIERIGGATAELVVDPAQEYPFLKTATGLRVELWTRSPAHDLLSQCCLCLTTVGANTAELGALGVPMLVLVPTQQLDAMRTWDGLPGLMASLPLIGSGFAKVLNWLALRNIGLLAWPNIWAKAQIVPELVGELQPSEVAKLAVDYLHNPEKLQQMRDRLRCVRGQPGAALKLAQLVCEQLVP